MLKWIWCSYEGHYHDFYLWDVWIIPDYFCKILIPIGNSDEYISYNCVLFSYSQISITYSVVGERGHCFPSSFEKEATEAEVTFHNSIMGKFMVNKIYLKQIYFSYSRTPTFRMLFCTFCYYFLSQHCCWTETKILVKNFLFFGSLHFPQIFWWPPALSLLRLLPVFYLIPPINWASSQIWLSKFRSQNC